MDKTEDKVESYDWHASNYYINLRMVVFAFSSHYLTTGQQKAIAISLLFIALAILYRGQAHIKKQSRVSFPGGVKAVVLRRQKYRCAICKEKLELYQKEFHHKNGDRSNNKPSNCQVLCPQCHRRNHAEELKLDVR